MKVAFFCPSPNERGTSVAVYDYAHFNETLLKNESFIITRDKESPALKRFRERFPIFVYHSMDEVDAFIRKEGIAVCYMLVHGRRNLSEGRLPSVCKLAVHCVFRSDTPFGDAYACISSQVNRRSGTCCPVVPHIVHLPEVEGDLRKELGIPEEATVFGRHGGEDTFNLQFAHQTIEEVIDQREDVYFLFMNTRPFLKLGKMHPRVIHLPASYSMEYKVAFINTCDAMLHARKGGETFGLSVGEFSIKNKPVLTWDLPQGIELIRYRLWHSLVSPLIKGKQRLPKATDRAHLEILGDKALIYHNAKELYQLLTNFDRRKSFYQQWDAYSEHYSPEVVMPLFQDHFL